MKKKVKEFESKLDPVDIINNLDELRSIVKKIDNQCKYAITARNLSQLNDREHNQGDSEESKHDLQSRHNEDRNNLSLIQASPSIKPPNLSYDKKSIQADEKYEDESDISY